MSRLFAILALSTAFTLVACNDPNTDESEFAEAPIEAPVATPAEDASAPVAAPSAADTPPSDVATLPPATKSSEESVQPESETLFY